MANADFDMALRDPAILCAESIATLHFLHHVPAKPSSNPVTNIHSRSAGYTLTFEKERDLAGTLAFLAYPKHGIDHIPAVCIEEDSSSTYLNILIAVNKSSQHDGQQLLERLKGEFDEIFSILARADGSLCGMEDDVFKAIISMCRKRILHRLRLIRSRNRTPIKEALEVALQYFKYMKPRNTQIAQLLESFIDRAKEVVKLTDSWNKHQEDFRLGNLAEGIYRLHRVGDLGLLLKEIPKHVMDPGLQSHLLNMIGKVSRYREAARFLYRMAKKVPLSRRMRIVTVKWPATTFDRPSDNYTPKLETIISSSPGLKDNERTLTHICRLLNGHKNRNHKSTRLEENDKFTRQTRTTLRTAKIHAEIQLLYYCELNIPHDRLPRVVCSSKDACWLCNEFILMYEKIHMPKTHGRLYPLWRLPALHHNDDFAKTYNKRLQGNLTNSLKTLFARQEPTTYPDPNESTLLMLHLSHSTLSTESLPLLKKKREVVHVEEVVVAPGKDPPKRLVEEPGQRPDIPDEPIDESAFAGDKESKDTLVEADKKSSKTSLTGKESVDEKTGEKYNDKPEVGIVKMTGEGNDHRSSGNVDRKDDKESHGEPSKGQTSREAGKKADGTDARETGNDPEYPSRTGTSISSISLESDLTLESGELVKGQATPLYAAGPIEIQVEYAKSDANSPVPGESHERKDKRKKLSYAVEWLNPNNAKRLRDRGVVPVVAGELGDGWIDGDTDADGCVYLSHGDSVLRVFMRPVPVEG
ncbi:hypothetical protein M426DRAFT_265560 [Hypoxylon sp. CI-4A]|nr:hypothetical protein M426DRAFT_265560 [Hypoxylon sp. CI-4A]